MVNLGEVGLRELHISIQSSTLAFVHVNVLLKPLYFNLKMRVFLGDPLKLSILIFHFFSEIL